MTAVDPNAMSEATRALLWVIGALLAGGGGYVLGNKRKVQLEPNRVEVAPDSCTQLRTSLERQVDEHGKAVEILALRLSTTEKEVAELKGQMPHINQGIRRIETKLDAILGKVRL